MNLRFTGEPFWWRGPAPFVFVAVPPEAGAEILALSRELSYGWGVIPVRVTIGGTTWTTSLFPKNGSYLVPIKAAVQKAERVETGQPVELEVALG